MEIIEGRLDKILGKWRYHSVIATSYNFDPLFISKVFIPILHSKRIRNILIITDPKEFYATFINEEALTGIKGSSTVIIPANCDRLFHPKLMYFVGEKEGLCIIGSGNLTHSGMGGNSEIWGAFHCTKDKKENAHIFQQAWKFLREYIPSLTGIANAKSEDWIVDNAVWLNEILSESYSIEDEEVFLLTNSEDQTIWDSLEEIIQDQSVTEIIIASPFYDKQGLPFKKLYSRFPEAEINMIYDKQGTIPESTLHFDKLKCYSWQNINENKAKDSVGRIRLHAKFIYLKEKKGNEYLVFGSSNATRSGLGIDTNGSRSNIELSLLANANSNELRESLGINFDDLKPEAFRDIKVLENSLVEPADVQDTGLRPVYAEQENRQITIFFNQNIEGENVEISLYDRNEREIKNLSELEKNMNTLQYEIEESSENENIPKAFYLKLRDSSCKIPVYHYRELSLDNPDSRSELLRHTLSDIGTVEFGSLHDSFLEIFLELEEKRQKRNSSSSGTGSVDNSSEEEQEEIFYTRDELEEKSSSHISHSSDSFISDGILALLSALNRQLYIDENEEINREALKTDSSEEIEHDEQDNSQKKKPEEVLNSVKGYRNYFNRVIRYYRKFLGIYDRTSNSKFPSE